MARNIPGNSSECGTLSHHSPIRTRCTRAWKMLHCFVQRTAEKPGKRFLDCAGTAPARNGSRARAECACTPLCLIRKMREEYLWRFRRRELFAATMAEKPGSPSTKA